MAMVDHEPRTGEPAPAALALTRVLPPGEALLGSAVGLADAEPWRKVVVGVTPARMAWVDAASGEAVLATHDALSGVHFRSYEAPPWPVYLDVEAHADNGSVVLLHPDGTHHEVRGRLRASALHHALDTVRLACDDACALELLVRDVRRS